MHIRSKPCRHFIKHAKNGKACYIPIGHKSKGCLKKEIVIKKLKPILEDKSVKKIGQNIKFDFIVLFKQGVNMNSMKIQC